MTNFDIDLDICDIIQMYNEFIEYSNKVDKLKCKHRRPNFPEHISENMIKFIINNYSSNNICKRLMKNGDLVIDNNKIECKTISSDGPISWGT